MDLELQKDKKKFYIKVVPDFHKEKAQVIELHLKQAQSLLMGYN